MRSRFWLCAALVVTAAQVAPMLETVSAQSGATGIVISELRASGPMGTNDEFIELFNTGDADVSIEGWWLKMSNSSGAIALRMPAMPAGATVKAGCYFLLTFARSTPTVANGYSEAALADFNYGPGLADDGSVGLFLPDQTTVVDKVAFSATTGLREGPHITPDPALPLPTPIPNRSFERKPGGGAGHVDTGNNAADFQKLVPSNPHNSATCLESSVLPHAVQGNGATSPMVGQLKTVKGVVTARTVDGFFIQTEPGDEDSNAATSEGLFVFTAGAPPAAAQVERLVKVKGTVEEFAPLSDPGGPTRTQLTSVTVTDAGEGDLPDAYVLTAADLPADGTLDQLEHLEGMLVNAPSVRAVSGTGTDGAFYAVLGGQPRPFRTAGVEDGYPLLPCAAGSDCAVPTFNGNPHRLRVDSDARESAAAVHVWNGVTLSNVNGPLDFGARTYTVVAAPLAQPSFEDMPLTAVVPAPSHHYTVASFNAQRAGDVDEAVWLAKASMTVSSVMGLPDVVALQGVDGTAAQALAAQINADAPSASYRAVFAAGSDVAFLLNSRVTGEHVAPVGDADTFTQPSLVLEATIEGPATSLPQPIAVLANHLEPVNGVLATRQAQANFLADYVRGRQNNGPNEALVVLGDFNAFSFNDGYVDTVGTVLGTPALATQVAFATTSMDSPVLVDLGAASAAAEQYSFVLNGNAQTHEHVLVSANLESQFAGLARPRVNGDFPAVLRHVLDTPSRASEKDPVVVSFSFPPDVNAPEFGDAPGVTAEATGPGGAAVEFDNPEADDNLDEVVNVTCTPASGAVFQLGNSGVSCVAVDAAGNDAEVSFTVTVEDTTPPSLAVPEDVHEEAASPDGQVVTFAAHASDLVSGSIAVSCTPVSGSLFPIGTTAVDCLASDAAGNQAQASFSVSISRPVPGRMRGSGTVSSNASRVSFTFEVGESSNFVERGWLMVHVKDGAGRPSVLVGAVNDVSFDNAEGYVPGSWPASGVDTVVFSGAGWWNGRSGYTFEVTASDHGEPGPGQDTFTLTVKSAAGEVVAGVSGVLKAGNLQSLR